MRCTAPFWTSASRTGWLDADMLPKAVPNTLSLPRGDAPPPTLPCTNQISGAFTSVVAPAPLPVTI
ncbi:hypothetical protein NDY24_06775 [Xanthomonas hortorum pv. pelargonii]|nr:hypothetical protein NDY24_06775 [Xanthomonas hortorum pv. pelargonii]